MKYLILSTLAALVACQSSPTTQSITEGDSAAPVATGAAAPAPASVGGVQAVVTIPTAPATSFCVPHDLRDAYSTPIPVGGALNAALTLDPAHASHTADPVCLAQDAIVSGGRTYIPCAVNNGTGLLDGQIWQSVDRVWVTGALNREISLQSVDVTVSTQVMSTGTMFFANSDLKNYISVVISIGPGLTFGGFCQ